VGGALTGVGSMTTEIQTTRHTSGAAVVGLAGMLAVMLTVAGVAACSAAGEPPAGPGDRWRVGPTGPAPTIVPNPSLPPVGAMITTGLRLDGQELVLAFGRLSGTVSLEAHLYDSATGVVASGPAPTMGWLAPDQTAPGFVDITEAALDDSHVLEWGYARGPVARITVRQDGAEYPVATAVWSADRDVTAFWVLRPGKPSGNWHPRVTSPLPDDKLPVFTALNHNGTNLHRVLFKLLPQSPPFI